MLQQLTKNMKTKLFLIDNKNDGCLIDMKNFGGILHIIQTCMDIK